MGAMGVRMRRYAAAGKLDTAGSSSKSDASAAGKLDATAAAGKLDVGAKLVVVSQYMVRAHFALGRLVGERAKHLKVRIQSGWAVQAWHGHTAWKRVCCRRLPLTPHSFTCLPCWWALQGQALIDGVREAIKHILAGIELALPHPRCVARGFALITREQGKVMMVAALVPFACCTAVPAPAVLCRLLETEH